MKEKRRIPSPNLQRNAKPQAPSQARSLLIGVWFFSGAWMLLLGAFCASAQLPAFPGAEGFGAFATGGRGGDVYCVTSLNSSGPGSFAEALATIPPEGRTITFGVSGYIPINKARITKSKVTIAGQTAPGDGIGFQGGPLIIAGNEVVIRHARFRYGRQPAGGDCINIERGVTNVMLDHLSLQFSTDENLSSFSKNPRPDRLTFQWSINAWGLETHSAGGLWDVNRVTTHHTLWAHNHTRNPKARPDGLLDWINNVTFDYDIGFIMGDSASAADWKANVRGNYFIRLSGGENSHALEKARTTPDGKPNFTLHVGDNLFDKNGNTVLDGKDYGYAIASGTYSNAATPIPAGGGLAVTIDPPLLAYKKIASQVGVLRLDAACAKPVQDELDTILIRNLLALKRHRVRHQNETGASLDGFGRLESATAPADSDRDGLPDFWETAIGSNPKLPDHNQPVGADAFVPAGFTRLEEYLHFRATPHGIIQRAPNSSGGALTVDLGRYTAGFTIPPVRFSVTNAFGGQVELSAPATAQFTAAQKHHGRAGFRFTVRDGEGSAWTQDFLILVTPTSETSPP
jgi:pectate lyase